MKASVVDLRYRMAEILAALDRREEVIITSHGKERGTIVPKTEASAQKAAAHPFFGMASETGTSVEDVMNTLRSGRTDAI